MAGHSAFSTNLDGIKHVALGNTAIKKIGFFSNNVMDVVWSGASLVSYYDGTTLLGQEEVDEGEDVLHPSLTIEKENYTLVGFSTTNGGERITTLNATGEPMNVYAIFVPNELTVVQGSLPEPNHLSYSILDSRYVTGRTEAHFFLASAYAGGGSGRDEGSFTIQLGYYSSADVSCTGRIDSNSGYGSYGWSNISHIEEDTTMSLWASGASYGTDHCYVQIALTSVVLKNPIPWE